MRLYNNNKKRILLAVALCVLCVTAAQAQNFFSYAQIEEQLRPKYVPMSVHRPVFQEFMKKNYSNKNSFSINDLSNITIVWMVYPKSAEYNRYEAAHQAEQQKAAAAAQAARDYAARYNYQLRGDIKLYADQDFETAVVASLKKGTHIHIEEYGEYTDYEDETAKWARVTLPDGKTGWVFSGYLQER